MASVIGSLVADRPAAAAAAAAPAGVWTPGAAAFAAEAAAEAATAAAAAAEAAVGVPAGKYWPRIPSGLEVLDLELELVDFTLGR